MAQTTYCNITTDLHRAYPRLEESKEYKTIRGWVVHSGSIYKRGGTGYVSALFENSLPLTSVAAVGSVTAGTFFYDADSDVLYVQATSGQANSSSLVYKAGEDWDALKTWAVQAASRDAEALLDARFPVPLPESPQGSVSQKYDLDLTRAVAKISASHIMARREPMVFEPEPNLAASLYLEGKAILDEYNRADRHFSWEVTQDEAGFFTIRPESDITGDGILQVRAGHKSWHDDFWRVKITTGGAIGTATYQYSTDNGASYNGTDITTSRLWQEITGQVVGNNTVLSDTLGFFIRFLDRGGTFDADDEWQIEIHSATRGTPSRSRMVSRRIEVG